MKHRILTFHNFLFLVGVLFLTTWYSLLVLSYVESGQVKGSDFRWFYSVGKVARQYGFSKVYDLELTGSAQEEVAGVPVGDGLILLPNHPPFVFPVMALLAALDFKTAYCFYFVGVWLLTASIMIVLFRWVRKRGWPRLNALILIIGLLSFEPLFISVLKGQDSYLLLIGGLLLFIAFLDDKDWLGGVGLGLMLIRPQIALVLAISLVFWRRKMWWWFIMIAVLLGIYSVVQVGWNGTMEFIEVLKLSTGVKDFGWDEVRMFDSVGLLLRVAPSLNLDIIHALCWGIYGVTLVGLCLLWRLKRTFKYWYLSITLTLSLFSAPHLHYHDLALLAIPLAGLVIVGVERKKINVAIASGFPMIASMMFLVSEFLDPARFTLPYLLMAGLPIWTWWLERDD